MASQNDWTQPIPEPKIYPGTLRGYRHFKDSVRDAELCLKPTNANFSYPIIGATDWWESFCTQKKEHEKVPDKDCTCGFYVNYYPTETFYTSDWSMPRAVVETCGKIVLSKRGFRAEKMRLVAVYTEYTKLYRYLVENFPHVKLFFDREEMYEAYPQEDLTSLIGTDEERLKPEENSGNAYTSWPYGANSTWQQIGYGNISYKDPSYYNPNQYGNSYRSASMSNNCWNVMTHTGQTRFDFTNAQMSIFYYGGSSSFVLPFSMMHNMTVNQDFNGISSISFSYNGWDYTVHADGRFDGKQSYPFKP